jgi:hypothetical protein
LKKFLEMKEKSEQLVMQNQPQADDDTWGRLETVAFSQDSWGRLETVSFSQTNDFGGLEVNEQKEEEQEGQEYGYNDDYESVVSLVLNNATEHTKPRAHENSNSINQNKKSKKQDRMRLNKFLEMKQKSEQLVMQNQSKADGKTGGRLETVANTWALLETAAFSHDSWGRLESAAFSQTDDLVGLEADDQNEQDHEGQEYGYNDDYESVVSLVLNNATEYTALCQLQLLVV